jgi:leucyl-tRNA synthetase
VEGVSRFLARVWRLMMTENQAGEWELSSAVKDIELTKAQQKITHATVKKVTQDIDGLAFNTAISQMMIFVNAFIPQGATDTVPISAMRTFLVLLNPFAPHISSELWQQLKSPGDITDQPWPTYDARFLIEDEIEIVLQVNGKVRDRMKIPVGASEEEAKQLAFANLRVQQFITGKQIRKIVFVPDKLINLVV